MRLPTQTSDDDNDIPEIRFPLPSSPEKVARIRQQIEAVQLRAASSSPPRPFLVITPLGMAWREEIASELQDRHITVLNREPIADWARAATPLYVRTLEEERLRVALAFERLWRAICLNQQAERWDLAGMDDLERLAAEKRSLRARIGTLRFRLQTPDVVWPRPDKIVRLQVLHCPDLDRFAEESRILDTMQLLTQPLAPSL